MIIANRSGTIQSPSSSHTGKMCFKGVLSYLFIYFYTKKVIWKMFEIMDTYTCICFINI